MNKKVLIGVIITFLLGVGGYFAYQNRPRPAIETRFVPSTRDTSEEENSTESNENRQTAERSVELEQPRDYVLLENPQHVYQTFNNCGPATLSMALSWYGINASQEELGNRMRPYQNPQGDNDDKTIFTYEFVDWAQEYGVEAIERVNGDIELLKKFTANGIPVVVKTWLNPGEDIGHFRLVRGFDERGKVIIQDDSYHGPNRKIAYFDFLSMWQPFNYNYMIIYTPDIKDKVEAIIGSELKESTAWRNALERAERETQLDGESPYPDFNISTASYHLGDYERSVEAFERVENDLPRRMLWYQIEPILAYKELGMYDRAFEITDRVLENGNRAYSELYMVRGEIYLEQGKTELAREQFELAVHYNENLSEAKENLLRI